MSRKIRNLKLKFGKSSVADFIVFDNQKSAQKEFSKSKKDIPEDGLKKIDGTFIAIPKEEENSFRYLGSMVYNKIEKEELEKATISLENSKQEDKIAFIEAFILSSYTFETFKSDKKEKEIDIKFSGVSEEELEKSFTIVESILNARDDVNTPPNIFNPEYWENHVKELSSKNPSLKVKVIGEKELKKEKMGLMLAVGNASPIESKLIHLSYKPKSPKGKVVLVGKGLTYDTGGLSLKPGNFMTTMKADKSGGVAVMHILDAISKIGSEYEVHGFIGAVENAIGGKAYRPDDVITSKSGKTVEILNTDAEGRLVLADVLSYAQEQVKDIDYLFDYATLTGACVVGLGEYTIGVMGNNRKLIQDVSSDTVNNGEYLNPLFFNKHLVEETTTGSIADIANISNSRYGGAQSAGIFLEQFIEKENKNKWCHFDIAGPAFTSKPWGWNPKGASGSGVKFTVDFLTNKTK